MTQKKSTVFRPLILFLVFKEGMGGLVDVAGSSRIVHGVEVDTCYIVGHQVDNLIHCIGQTGRSERFWVVFVFFQNGFELSWQSDIFTGFQKTEGLIAVDNGHNTRNDGDLDVC